MYTYSAWCIANIIKWYAGLVTTYKIYTQIRRSKRQYSVAACYQHFLWISLLILFINKHIQMTKFVNINLKFTMKKINNSFKTYVYICIVVFHMHCASGLVNKMVVCVLN